MLIIITVGETVADTDKIFVGQGYSPMTDEGKEQILDSAHTLSPYHMDAIYSSDLLGAQEVTSAITAANTHDTIVELVEELRERSGGSYEGKKYTEIRVGMSPKKYKVWERDPLESPEFGESLDDVVNRVSPWFKTVVIPRLKRNETVLIVSHPDTVRALLTLARGDGLDDALSMTIEKGLPYFYHGTYN